MEMRIVTESMLFLSLQRRGMNIDFSFQDDMERWKTRIKAEYAKTKDMPRKKKKQKRKELDLDWMIANYSIF